MGSALDGGADAIIDQDHRELLDSGQILDAGGKLQAVESAHASVGDHQVVAALVEGAQCARRVVEGLDLEAVLGQCGLHRL